MNDTDDIDDIDDIYTVIVYTLLYQQNIILFGKR